MAHGNAYANSLQSEIPPSTYSDDILEEFRQIILEKLEKARHDLQLLNEACSNLANPNDILDTCPTFKVLEEGYQVMSKEENAMLASRQEKFIQNLENALVRIENKTYGRCNCDQCNGKLIDKDRLKCVPHSLHCINSKDCHPKNGNGGRQFPKLSPRLACYRK